MIQRDYIVRMTELLAKALAKIVLLKEQARYEQALDEINLAGKELLGRDFDLLKNLSYQDLLKWMTSYGYFDSAKCVSLCQLLRTEGEVLELQGDEKKSKLRYLQALNLMNEALLHDEQTKNEQNTQMIEWLLNKTLRG